MDRVTSPRVWRTHHIVDHPVPSLDLDLPPSPDPDLDLDNSTAPKEDPTDLDLARTSERLRLARAEQVLQDHLQANRFSSKPALFVVDVLLPLAIS